MLCPSLSLLSSKERKRILGVFCLALAATLLWATLLCAAPAPAPLTRDGETVPYTTETFPYSLAFMQERLEALFDSDARDYYEDYPAAIYVMPEGVRRADQLPAAALKGWRKRKLTKATKFYVFYGDYAVMQRRLSAIGPLDAIDTGNAALARYAALPLTERAHDLYLWSPDTPFWYSEYRLMGIPVPFRSYFILHLSASGAERTQVEVIEDEPVIDRGPEPNVDIYGKLHEEMLQPVPPTTRERLYLLSCIRQFIEREVPGRHWFNCRLP